MRLEDRFLDFLYFSLLCIYFLNCIFIQMLLKFYQKMFKRKCYDAKMIENMMEILFLLIHLRNVTVHSSLRNTFLVIF